jgi:hypothetical protein
LEAVKIQPKNLSFGRVSRKSGPQTRKAVLTRGDGGPLALKLVGDNPSSIDAKLTEIKPGERYELEVTYTPSPSSDRVSARLRLDTGIPEAPAASVRVYANVTPRVTAQPKTVRIPKEREPDWQQTVRLLWDDAAPARLREATIDNPKLTVRVKEDKDQQVLVLGALPDYVVRSRRQNITLVTDDPETPEVKLPISVFNESKGRRTARKTPSSRSGQERNIKKPKSEATTTKATVTPKPKAPAPE